MDKNSEQKKSISTVLLVIVVLCGLTIPTASYGDDGSIEITPLTSLLQEMQLKEAPLQARAVSLV